MSTNLLLDFIQLTITFLRNVYYEKKNILRVYRFFFQIQIHISH